MRIVESHPNIVAVVVVVVVVVVESSHIRWHWIGGHHRKDRGGTIKNSSCDLKGDGDDKFV